MIEQFPIRERKRLLTLRRSRKGEQEAVGPRRRHQRRNIWEFSIRNQQWLILIVVVKHSLHVRFVAARAIGERQRGKLDRSDFGHEHFIAKLTSDAMCRSASR